MGTNIRKSIVVRNSDTAICKNKPVSGSPLDTLAKSGTRDEFDEISLCNTTTSEDKKTLLKRARRKYFSTGLSLSLVSASEHNKSSILTKSYWNTYHCNAVLQLRESGKITGKYCKNRWCMVCNAVRTARSIIDYIPVIKTWDDAHMITLTIPNCSSADLPTCIADMHKSFTNIKDLFKKRYQRGNSHYKLVGVRKFECTYNSLCDTYHPHFHMILESKEMGEAILKEWLTRNTSCSSKAQDIRKADVNSLQELFKYMTKVISSADKDKIIYADALDVIFNAMRRKHVIRNFGFNLPESLDPFKGEKDESFVTSVYQWQQSAADWVDTEHGDMLTGYKPSDKFRNLIESKVVVRTTTHTK